LQTVCTKMFFYFTLGRQVCNFLLSMVLLSTYDTPVNFVPGV
jgi:hypothetical protein